MIVLDIETIAQPEVDIRAKLPPFDPDSVPHGNVKDPDKIAAKIADAKLHHGDDIVAKAALDARYGVVAVIGLYDGKKINQIELEQEPIMLKLVWEILGQGKLLSGFNIKGFDLPFMVRRSWFHGISVPQTVFNPFKPRYPWGDFIIDLLEVVRCGDYQYKTGGLSQVLKSFGLPETTGKGQDFGELWTADKQAALDYNKQDLECTYALAQRLGLQ